MPPARGGPGEFAALGLRHHRPAAREHAAELGRQREARRRRPLGQDVDVGEVEQLVQPLARLQRQQASRSGGRASRRSSRRPDRAGAAQDELDPGLAGEPVGDRGEPFQTLLLAHVAGVEHDHLIGR